MTELVPMNAENFRDAAAIEQVCFTDDPWSEAQFEEELSLDFSRTFIAYEDGKAAGFVNVWLTPPLAIINNIGVLPEFRRRGIASVLMEAAIGACDGCSSLSLEVRVSNTPAISLYEKHGFSNVGCRKRFYSNPREDAYIMTLFKLKTNTTEAGWPEK